jgi:agmatine deiminase
MDKPIPQPRWPAEWEPHRATWIAWPHQRRDWPGKFSTIPWVYAEIVRHLHQSESVGILVMGSAQENRARTILARSGIDLTKIEFHAVPTDRVWMRDAGPIFVKTGDGTSLGLDWRFTGWAKYPNHLDDDRVTARLGAMKGWRTLQPHFQGNRIVLEGGAIDGNGSGLLLTTEECLLSDVQQRNPGLNRNDYEQSFQQFLGVKKVLWLNRGIAGDDTHGHVDDLARFVGRSTIVAVSEDNPADDNYRPLQENLDRLRGMTDLEGKQFEVIPLPMPEPLYFDGTRLPASYANFYIANDCVLVPTFNGPQDRIALGRLAELFPGRKVVGIHAVDLVWGFGTLHCLTQQEPR